MVHHGAGPCAGAGGRTGLGAGHGGGGRFWGVPWAKIFCQCELVRKSEVLRNVCIRCKRHFNGEGVECEPCQKLRAIEEKEAQAAARRYWKKHYLREKSQ